MIVLASVPGGSTPRGGAIRKLSRERNSSSSSSGSDAAVHPVGGCPNDQSTESRPVEYCDIEKLSIQLTQDGKSQTIVIDSDRKCEGTHSDTPSEYHGFLSGNDLVLETLSDTKNLDGSGNPSSTSKPLTVKLTATNDHSHATISPAHPLTSAGVEGAAAVTSNGGAAVETTYHCVDGSVLGRGFAALNPLEPRRATSQQLLAEACGNRPLGEVAQRSRSAQLLVYPYEELSIEIGAYSGRFAGSLSATRNFGEMDTSARGHVSGREITSTVVRKLRTRGTETATTIENMRTGSGVERTRTTQTETEITPHFLGASSETVRSVEESWNNRNPRRTSDSFDNRKIVIKRKIGGVESSADISKFAQEAQELYEKFETMKKLFDDLQKVFSSARIGLSFSVSFEVLAGQLSLAFGNRWPNSYTESNRVYYIERYVKGGGQIDLFTGKLGAFFGFTVDPWYAPIMVDVGGYVDLSASVNISGTYDYSWTSPSEDGSHNFQFNGEGKLAAEGGVRANGRAAGYSVRSRLAIESQATLEVKAEIGSDTPIYAETTCRFGYAPASSGEAPAGVRLVGELVLTGRSVRTRRIKPKTLVEGREFWKDKPLIGTKNTTGTWQ